MSAARIEELREEIREYDILYDMLRCARALMHRGKRVFIEVDGVAYNASNIEAALRHIEVVREKLVRDYVVERSKLLCAGGEH